MEDKVRISIGGFAGFFLLFALNGAMWWYFRSYLNFIFAAVMLGVVILSAAAFWREKDTLSTRAALPTNNVGKGAAFTASLIVESTAKFLAVPVVVKFKTRNAFTNQWRTKQLVTRSVPMKSTTQSYTMESVHCGLFSFQITDFVVYDFFHLFYVHSRKKTDGHIIVTQGSDNHTERPLRDMVEGFPKEDEIRKRGSDYSADYEMREYIPGDDLKSIHWKLTAKQDKLMVRERLAAGNHKVNVILELAGDFDVNDKLMSSLHSVCIALLEENYPVHLFWWSSLYAAVSSAFIIEEGELNRVIDEILSTQALEKEGEVVRHFLLDNPGAAYILIQTGETKGAYIQ